MTLPSCRCGKPLVLHPDLKKRDFHYVCEGCHKSNWDCDCPTSIVDNLNEIDRIVEEAEKETK